ncbi:MAG: FAD-dependent oxidoreductase [Saprospiraceae bacterium]|nr:FAD-dependent oxidoreductase [Saprospiraceae bacterium]
MHIGIVGQGLAGTLTTFLLLRKGLQVSIIDPGTPNASSIASGLINPVTGRNYVKSWQIETLLKLADVIYPQLEEYLDIHCYQSIRLYRILADHHQTEKWMQRAILPGYEKYLTSDPLQWRKEISGLRESVEVGEVKLARWLDTEQLLSTFREMQRQHQALHQTILEPEHLTLESDQVIWKDMAFDYLVFAEGSGITNNPFFNWLPVKPSKGERLLIRTKSDFQQVMKASYFIIPYREEGVYWIGSPTDFSAKDELPSAEGRQKLEDHIRLWLSTNYELMNHAAAFRPASRDQRPVIGFHPLHPRLAVINGLGTKGVSLAPYLAHLMSERLVGAITSFPDEVDIARFEYPKALH